MLETNSISSCIKGTINSLLYRGCDYRGHTEHRLLVIRDQDYGLVCHGPGGALTGQLGTNHLIIQGQNLNFKCNALTLSEPRNPNTAAQLDKSQ